MSSLPPPTLERTTPMPVRSAFNWIETLAIPISFTIMETQPIVVLLFFFALVLVGPGTTLPLNEVSITLLLLGLQWWAMFINQRLRRGMSQRMGNILLLLGVASAFGLMVWTQWTVFDPVAIVVIAGLAIFCWKRGIDKARAGLDDEQMMLVFKFGLVILLIVLCLSVIFPDMRMAAIFPLLSYALPLFFLSGLICLSFMRVGMIRREYARQGTLQAETTRGWLVALTFMWIIVVAGAFTLEIFSFNMVQRLLLPLLNIIVTIVAWIIFIIVWVIESIFQLLSFLFHAMPANTKMPQRAQPALTPSLPGKDTLPAWLVPLLEILLIAVALLLLFVLFRAILRHIRPAFEQDSEEEIREVLSMRDILKQRRQERKQQAQPKEEVELEVLDPASARARYRELLLHMAERDQQLGRQLEETPNEYQERLIALVEQSADDATQDDVERDRALLADLTHAYTSERYGGEFAGLGQHGTIHTWIAHLSERLERNRKK